MASKPSSLLFFVRICGLCQCPFSQSRPFKRIHGHCKNITTSLAWLGDCAARKNQLNLNVSNNPRIIIRTSLAARGETQCTRLGGLLLGCGMAHQPEAILTDPPKLSWVQKEWTAAAGGLGYSGNKGRTSRAKALPSLSLRAA